MSKDVSHVEYPMFGGRTACGKVLRHVKRYTWLLHGDKKDDYGTPVCKSCRTAMRNLEEAA